MTNCSFFLIMAWISIAAALAALNSSTSILFLFGAGLFYMLIAIILKVKEEK